MSESYGPLWFLPCLFAASVIFMIVISKVDSQKETEKWRKNAIFGQSGGIQTFIIMVVFGGVGFVMSKFKPSFGYPFNIDVAMVSMPFVFCGYMLINVWMRIINELETWKKVAIIIMCATTVFALYKHNIPVSSYGTQYVAMSYSTYGNPLLFYINGLIGSFAIVVTSSMVESKILCKIGSVTLTVLLIHGAVLRVSNKVFEILGLESSGWFYCLIAIIGVLISSDLMDNIFKKYFPNSVGQQTPM